MVHFTVVSRHLQRHTHKYTTINTYGRRAFSAAGRTVWISLPDFIRDPTISADCFRHLLKMYAICLLDTSAFRALEVLDDNIYLLIYLLTDNIIISTIYSSSSGRITSNTFYH